MKASRKRRKRQRERERETNGQEELLQVHGEENEVRVGVGESRGGAREATRKQKHGDEGRDSLCAGERGRRKELAQASENKGRE